MVGTYNYQPEDDSYRVETCRYPPQDTPRWSTHIAISLKMTPRGSKHVAG